MCEYINRLHSVVSFALILDLCFTAQMSIATAVFQVFLQPIVLLAIFRARLQLQLTQVTIKEALIYSRTTLVFFASTCVAGRRWQFVTRMIRHRTRGSENFNNRGWGGWQLTVLQIIVVGNFYIISFRRYLLLIGLDFRGKLEFAGKIQSWNVRFVKSGYRFTYPTRWLPQWGNLLYNWCIFQLRLHHQSESVGN